MTYTPPHTQTEIQADIHKYRHTDGRPDIYTYAHTAIHTHIQAGQQNTQHMQTYTYTHTEGQAYTHT